MPETNRSKSSDAPLYQESFTTTYYANGNVWSGPNSNGLKLTSRVMSNFDGQNIPNYFERKKRGDLLPYTPFEQYSADYHWSGLYDVVWPGGEKSYITVWDFPTSVYPVHITKEEMQDIAAQYDPGRFVGAAASKIYSQGHDTLTFLAELHKTVAMFKGAWTKLFAMLAKGEGIVDANKLWLEFRYGWRILYYDIVEIQKTLSTLDDSRKRFSERTGTKHTETAESTTFRTNSVHDWDVKTQTEYSISERGSVTADIELPKFQFNPITTSWELVKFSFIIDWFIAIGTWLESLSFLALSTNYTAAAGIKINASRRVWLTNLVFNNGYSGVVHFDSYSKATYTVRVPQSVSLLPSVNVNLSVPKVADLWAIFSTGGDTRRLRHF